MLIFDVKLQAKNIQNNYRTNVLKQLDFIKKKIFKFDGNKEVFKKINEYQKSIAECRKNIKEHSYIIKKTFVFNLKKK